MLTGRGNAGAIATLAIAAVAIAGLAAAPAANVGPWEAHAQSTPTTVNVGAIMANATGSDFGDDNRTAVLERAVVLFNGMYDDIELSLAVTELTRNEAVSADEPRALLEAYGSGSGPRFYIGPMTSEGLTHIRENATTRALLDGDDVLIVTPSSEAPRLAIDDNIFRLAFNVARQGDMLVEEMKSANITSYIVVARNDAWGQDIAAHIDARAAQEGLARTGDPIMFELDRSRSHWEGIRDMVAARASAAPADGGRMGVFFLGYGGDYDDMAAAANTSAAIRANSTWFAPSSAGIGAPSTIANGTTRDFSQAVGLTALSQDIEDNAVKRGIDRHLFSDGSKNATFYEYSTHDSVFVLGSAMRMAMAAGEDPASVAAVKKYIAPAAMNYTDAALGGGLLLNGDGDLRAPDSFTVHTMNRTTGAWSDGRTVGSTVTPVGALLALDNTDYSDNNAGDALLAAAADYNEGTDRRPLVKLITYDITDPADSGGYVALDALTAAHGGGSGPSAYIGPSLSSNVEAVLPYATSNNILLIGYASESESLSKPGDNLFRTAISTDRHGRFMAEAMADAGVESVVTVVRNDPWGLSSNASIAAALGPNNLKLAGSVQFDPHTAAWGPTLADISSAIAMGTGKTGVAFVGVRTEQDSLAPAALADAAANSTQWFVTPSGFYSNTTRIADFAKAVNLTAIVLDVEANDKSAALDAKVPGLDLDFYDYAAYDSLFILGNAIAAAVGSDKSSTIAADDLRPLVPAQADAYDGILGDIALDTNGDLGSPDRFAVWQVNGTGEWENTGTAKSTPVVRIGALLAIDNTDYSDNLARDALQQASADFNARGAGADRPFFVSLTTHDITNRTDSGKYVALDALTAAHDGGNGPSVYIGPSLSSNIEQILNYSAMNDLLLLGYASESESLSIPGDNLFRTAISTARHGHFMAQVMADADVRSVVTVVRDDSWGRSLNTSIVEALGANGLQLAGAVGFAPGGDADWPAAIGEISSAIAEGSGATGVAFVGVQSEQDALAVAAQGNAAITAVPWFVTPSGYYQNMPDATRSFARSVGMTAIVLDVADSAGKSALDAKVAGDLSFYEYAAYDGLLILADSVAAAAGDDPAAAPGINATGLRAVIPPQADMYEGILGDIALNSKGDLRSPDRFAVWQVDGTTGMWVNTGATKSTPVVDVGAIVIRDSDRFDDTARYEAMRIAVDDYNLAAEDGGALYLNLREVRTSLSPTAPDPAPSALDAVMAASEGEDGTRYYVGPSTSGNSQRVLEYANANNLTLISPSSTAPSLAIGDDALFRLVPNDSQQGKVLADIVHNQQGALLAALINQTGREHVVMVVRNDTWGLGLAASTSARLANVPDIDITRIIHEESDADWSKTAMDIEDEIDRVRTATPSDPIAVLHIGFPGDFVSLAARAAGDSPMRTVPWFGTDGVAGSALILRNDTARQFADAVNLTATKFDVVSNDKFNTLTAALESRGVAVRTTYEYSAYDSVFVLARAIEAAISAKGDSYGPLDVRSSVRAAAADYEGALGDIELNKAGDLRTPNSYATWTIDAAINGSAWTKVDTHPSTPVFDVGALLMLDNNPIYTDDLEKAAMDQAVDDFNTDHELIGDFYINLAVQRISTAPSAGSPDPDALTGLMNIYANGDGPSLYAGPSASGNAGRILGYANDNDIVLISHSSTAPSLAIPGDNLFRMVAPDSRQGAILANLISGDGVTDLVMAVRGDTWGRGVDETTAAGLAGGTTVSRVSFSESEADWPGVAASLGAAIDSAAASAAAKPQGKAAVLFIGFDGDFNGVASQASSVPSLSSVGWFGPDGVGNSQAVISNATSLAFAKDVGMTTVIFTVRDNDVKATLDPSAVYGPSAYDTVRIMGAAINASYTAGSGTVPPALAVKAAIPAAAAAYTGALGDVALDANGDLLSPAAYGIYRIGAGDAWNLVCVQEVGGPPGACDIRYITIGELFSPQAATIGSINDAVHNAYVLAVEDYNREREAENSQLRIQLQRADLSVTLPTRGADGGAPAPNSRPSWDLGGVIDAYAGGSGPVVYLGPIATSAARPLAALAAENGLVMVSPTIASANLTARDNMFRLSLSDKHEADLITIAAQREGVETILPVLTTSTGQSSYGDEIRMEAEILGMTYLDPVYIPFTFAALNLSSTVAELNTTVAGLQSAGTDLSSVGIITEGPHKDFQSLALYAVEYPLLTSVKWFATTGIDPPHPIADPETLRLAQSGNLYSLSWDINQTDRFERVRDTLSEREGYPPNKYSYAAYDAVYLLADAIRMTMAMSPDGTYTGTDVASNMHVAADMLDGLLGDNLRLDENGGRILPNTVVIWKTTSEGAWEDTTDRAELPPICSISLKEDTLAFGNVRAGVPSDPAAQTIRDVGTLTASSVTIDATEWMNDAGSAVLGKGATKVMIGSGAWTSLPATASTAPDSVQTDAMFRLDVPSDMPESREGDARQLVEYTISCDP